MDQTLKTIVIQLTEKTKKGKVNWQMGSSSNEYRLVLPESTISISVYQSTFVYYVDCKVINERGDIVLRENTPQSTEDGVFLTSFYVLVRDTYTGKDKVISSLMQHLENDDVIGAPENDKEELPF